LCTAFLNGNPATSPTGTLPPQDSSTAFQALINQHGGIAATTAYCQGIVNTHTPPGQSGKTPANGSASPGNGASTGNGNGAGKPASPGNSGSHRHG
jgi:hypothetical protein